MIQDDGHGLVEGLESLRKLLVFSDSGFADPQVEEHQRPLGMGFYSLIANERITHLLVNDIRSEQVLPSDISTCPPM